MTFLLDELRSFFSTFFKSSLLAKMMIAIGLGLVFIFIFTVGSNVQAEPPAIRLDAPDLQDAAGGQAIFEQMCTGCHTIGGGKLVGPDLKDITQQRDPQWIKSFITDPAKMIASDADAQALYKEYNNITMPTLGLSADQVNQLVEYLSNPGVLPTTPAPSAPAGTGDPAAGEQLFSGGLALTNGGPHCIACHTVSGVGGLGGGGLGPDLTNVVQRYGEPGLSAALKTISFPTMLGPFQNRPLTSSEQTDLLAFFKYANQWNAPVKVITPGALTGKAALIFTIGVSGAVLLFVILLAIWVRVKKRTTRHLPIRKL